MTGHPEKHGPPSIQRRAFQCPHCRVLARQFWHTAQATETHPQETPVLRGGDETEDLLDTQREHWQRFEDYNDAAFKQYAMLLRDRRPVLVDFSGGAAKHLENVWFSRCDHCSEIALWIWDTLVWPLKGSGALPNADMPRDVREDYEEASHILSRSPRGATALLRLSIEKLCKHLDVSGQGLNDKIATLVRNGLPVKLQQALDTVRVVGNNAVHPGQMDLNDDRETAETLFDPVNLIVDSMISQPKRVSALFDKLPQNIREGIKRRDAEQS